MYVISPERRFSARTNINMHAYDEFITKFGEQIKVL